jgi:transposase
MILFNQLHIKREIKRALVVKWSWSGLSYRQIIKQLNVSLGFIIKWNNKFLIGE